MSAIASGIAPHVEAAKRLLQELEQNAGAATATLGRDSGSDFLAALEERDGIIDELRHVVDALTQERESGHEYVEAALGPTPLADELAKAAARVLESHKQLVLRTRHERDRLAASLKRAKQPDVVADQYRAATDDPLPRTLSVTG